eukprot:scaffold61108_cov20-Tisochrysis_lutea.AAC.1
MCCGLSAACAVPWVQTAPKQTCTSAALHTPACACTTIHACACIPIHACTQHYLWPWASTLVHRQVPGKAVKTIQERAGLQHELCTPLLGMVDQLGVSRAEAHRGVLQAARQALMARVQLAAQSANSREALVIACNEWAMSNAHALCVNENMQGGCRNLLERLMQHPSILPASALTDNRRNTGEGQGVARGFGTAQKMHLMIAWHNPHFLANSSQQEPAPSRSSQVTLNSGLGSCSFHSAG